MNVDFNVTDSGTRLLKINSYDKSTYNNTVGFQITSRYFPIVSILDNQGTTQRPTGSVSYSLSSAIMANLFEPALLKQLDFEVPSSSGTVTQIDSFPTLNVIGRIALGALVLLIMIPVIIIELKYGETNMDSISLISWIHRSKANPYLVQEISQMDDYDRQSKSNGLFKDGQPSKLYTLEDDALKEV
ncbi:hypothetical protein HDV06_001345 [Boothiomyces sp. JEL0866]|nr:hypothetical protein HDV06_001345 [Boothiomyces sp. JEL0866]